MHGLVLRKGHVLTALCLFLFLQTSMTQASVSVYELASSSSVIIDGKLDDAVWQSAPRMEDFRQTQPQPNDAVSQKTAFQVARDDKNLYLALRVFESDPQNRVARVLVQGESIESDDRVSIAIDTFDDDRNAYYFAVNAHGVRDDALLGNDYLIREWDAVWEVKTQSHEWGWSAEFAIPFKSLSFDAATTTWGLNVTRTLAVNGQELAWRSIDRHVGPSSFDALAGMSGLARGLGLHVTPSLVLQTREHGTQPWHDSFDPSLTAFYDLSSGISAGVTFKPDFSGTDVDERQLNLGRFSLFVPEKRDFFLKDASIFDFGGSLENARPFFSRRIGLSDGGQPLDIEWGTKLSGRSGDWSIGAVAAQQEVASPSIDDTAMVLRVKRNMGARSELGMITTRGDLAREQTNQVYGVDYAYRHDQLFGNQQFHANAWYQEARSDAWQGDNAAFGLQLNYPNYRYEGQLSYQRIEDNFEPALGFVNRRGVEYFSSDLRYRIPQSYAYWESFGSQFRYKRFDTLAGDLQSEEAVLNVVEGNSRGGDFYTLFLVAYAEGLDAEFNLLDKVTVPQGLYRGRRAGFYFQTGAHRSFSGSLLAYQGDFYSGERQTLEPQLAWKPNPHFSASVGLKASKLDLEGQAFSTRLYNASTLVAFNERWSWSTLLQGDNQSQTLSINSRIRYQPKANQRYLLELSHVRNTLEHEAIDTAITFKMSYTFQL